MNTTQMQRNSSIELLRILAMILIILFHLSYYGNFDFTDNQFSINSLWYNFLYMGGKIGVNIFVLISGYFLISSNKPFQFKKLIKLWGEIFFYSFTIYIIFLIFNLTGFSIKNLVIHCFPIIFKKYWFASVYFVLYILHPFLNAFLLKINKKIYQFFLFISFMMWCIIPTFTTRDFEGNRIIWFIFLYSLSSYIRLYGLNPKIKRAHWIVILIISLFTTYFSCLLILLLSNKYSGLHEYSHYFFEMQMLPTFISSISLFMIFLSMKKRTNKFINIVSSTTFGIYLIHDHSLISENLWKEIAKYQYSPLFILYSIGICLFIFIICSIIDLIRKNTIERVYIFCTNKCTNKILPLSNKFEMNLNNIIFGNKQDDD